MEQYHNLINSTLHCKQINNNRQLRNKFIYLCGSQYQILIMESVFLCKFLKLFTTKGFAYAHRLRLRRFLSLTMFLLLFLSSFNLFAQQNGKTEFELRVNRHEVPVKILEELADFLEEARRIRYFREFDGTSYFWEVKFIYEGRSFSVKFNQDYSLYDIEFLTHWRLAEREVRQPLISYFEQNYRRFRIIRLQYTFLPRTDISQPDFFERILDDDLPPPQFYEVEAEVISPTTGAMGFYEFIFDTHFNLVEKRIIIPVSDVNLHF